MNYNPYAVPQGASTLDGQQGFSRDWEIGEILGKAWEITKRSWAPFAIAVAVFFVVYFGVSLVVGFPTALHEVGTAGARDSAVVPLLKLVSQVVSSLASAFLMVGLLRIVLGLVRGEQPPVGTLFSGGGRLVPMIVSQLLVSFAVLLGVVLLIVPGIIIALGLSMTQYFIADSEMGAIDAMKASWEATKGHKLKLFLFHMVSLLLALAGCLACGVGVLPVAIVLGFSQALIFIRLSGRARVSIEGGGPPGFIPMQPVMTGDHAPLPGGYGAPPAAHGYAPPGGGPSGDGYSS